MIPLRGRHALADVFDRAGRTPLLQGRLVDRRLLREISRCAQAFRPALTTSSWSWSRTSNTFAPGRVSGRRGAQKRLHLRPRARRRANWKDDLGSSMSTLTPCAASEVDGPSSNPGSAGVEPVRSSSCGEIYESSMLGRLEFGAMPRAGRPFWRGELRMPAAASRCRSVRSRRRDLPGLDQPPA